MTAAAILALAKKLGRSRGPSVSRPPGSYVALAILAVPALWLVYGPATAPGKPSAGALHAAMVKAEIQRQQTVVEGGGGAFGNPLEQKRNGRCKGQGDRHRCHTKGQDAAR